MNLDITFDTKKMDATINKMVSGVINPRPFWNKVESYMDDFIDSTFMSQGVNLAGNWKALAKSTVQGRSRRGYGAGNILINTGKLKSSVKKQSSTNSEMRFGSKVPYYKYHQLGTRKMPQRQILGINNEIRNKMRDYLAEFITSTMS